MAGWLGGWVAGWLGGWVAGLLGGWVAGWLGGWVVGKSDFNENPVVSLDLDLDFGLRLRVCQNQFLPKGTKIIIYAA